jgi:hypothetical protein
MPNTPNRLIKVFAVHTTSPLYAVHVLIPIRFDRSLIDKTSDFVKAGLIVANFGHNFREHLNDQSFLLTLIKLQYSGFQFVKIHGYPLY